MKMEAWDTSIFDIFMNCFSKENIIAFRTVLCCSSVEKTHKQQQNNRSWRKIYDLLNCFQTALCYDSEMFQENGELKSDAPNICFLLLTALFGQWNLSSNDNGFMSWKRKVEDRCPKYFISISSNSCMLVQWNLPPVKKWIVYKTFDVFNTSEFRQILYFRLKETYLIVYCITALQFFLQIISDLHGIQLVNRTVLTLNVFTKWYWKYKI